ncbi:MAG: ferritin family protein [Chloroflexi bacterium]|nr:ferritin family protein [Chloroflexota bacterium]
MEAGLEEIFRRAVTKEEEAYHLYSWAQGETDDPATKTLLRELATEEQKHVTILENLRRRGVKGYDPPKLASPYISEYLNSPSTWQGANLQEIAVMAIKREEAAQNFYQLFAQATSDPEARRVLEVLAAAELSHKRRLEKYYEDVFLREG